MNDVAIVIPTLDRAAMLREVLESVAVLEPEPAEVVVVDCGSTDSSQEVAAAAGVRVIESPRASAAAARNAGAQATTAPYLGFLDSDDLVSRGKTSALASALDEDPEVVLAHGSIVAIDERARELASETRRIAGGIARAGSTGTEYADLVSTCVMYTSATLIRRSAFEAIGGYDESLTSYEDWDLYLRLSRIGGLLYVDAPAAGYRIWRGNVRWDRTAEGTIAVARKHLAALNTLAAEERARSEFGLRSRIAGSAYTLLDMRTARAEAMRALRIDPLRALWTSEVRRALTRSRLPRSLLARRRPAVS
jgi:glycosyltransferase involved in cell wall biosynthesis